MNFSKYIIILFALLASMASCGDNNSGPTDPGWNDNDDKTDGNLTVMSYNTRHCAPYDPSNSATEPNESAIATIISSKMPDIVFLQEMDKCTTRSNGVDQPKVIAARAKYPYYEFFKIMDYRGGEYGLSILSKYKLLSPVTHTLPSEIDNVSISSNNAVGSATISINGYNVFLICVHLSVYEAENKAQLKYILQNIVPKSLPTIIAGDFNSRPTSATIALLDEAGFTRTNTDASNFTIPSNNPNRELDYIAYRPADKWNTISHIVIYGTQASDHLPILSSIKLN